jgi:hypothetical protein
VWVDGWVEEEYDDVRRGKHQFLSFFFFRVSPRFFFFHSKLESRIHLPHMDDLVFISDSTFTREQILAMEQRLCVGVNFNMRVCTIFTFIHQYLYLLRPLRTPQTLRVFSHIETWANVNMQQNSLLMSARLFSSP